MQLELVLRRAVLVVEEVEEAHPARRDLVADLDVLSEDAGASGTPSDTDRESS
jgi:hypothetical protein